jgi:type II secretion system protein N
MPTDTKPALWKVILGYGAFALVAFVLCLFLTFPFDALRARVATEAINSGLAVRIGSLRPGFFGVTARDVQVSVPPGPLSADAFAALTSGDSDATAMMGAAVLGEPVIIDSLSLRPSLFPLGVRFSADAMGGTVVGTIGGTKELTVKVDAQGVHVDQGNLQAFSGLNMEGTLGGKVALTLPRGTGKDTTPDLSAANGELALDASGLVIKGGKVAIPLSPGSPPVPMDLPQVALGDIVGRIDFDKGQGTVKELRIKSEDLEVRAEGTVKLGRRVAYSEPALDVRIKAEPEFTKRLGLLGAGLTILPPDKQDPKFRAGRLTGFLNRPNFQPKR